MMETIWDTFMAVKRMCGLNIRPYHIQGSPALKPAMTHCELEGQSLAEGDKVKLKL